jgi:TetR/AcrR family transcriptional regulator, fatty acid biosynthesis regulator
MTVIGRKRGGADVPQGKRRLIEAGLRLAARGRALSSLGLRELGREAALNPNTFYRHFDDIDQLGVAAIEEVTAKLRMGLQQVRRGALTHADATRGSAEYFLEFVRRNPEAFLVGAREIHSGSPAIRSALRRVMDEIAAEITDDLRARGFAPTTDRALLLEVGTAIVDLMFHRSPEYLEHPSRRRAIVDRWVRLARILLIGVANAGDTADRDSPPKRRNSLE